jgi:tetratricopeptide (TPR) repeat protein
MQSNVAQLHLHERLWTWFEDNRTPVMWGAGTVLVIGLAAGLFVWHGYSRQASANDALSGVLNRSMPGNERPADPAALLQVAKDYPQTAAGGRALLLAGGDLFAAGKAREARPLFERYLREYRAGPFAGQALLGIASCQESTGSTNEAVSTYLDIVQHHVTDSVVPQAKFALARLYEAQGRYEQARDQLEELARNPVYNTLTADVSMRLENLFAKHPELAPARPVASTNMPPVRLNVP